MNRSDGTREQPATGTDPIEIVVCEGDETGQEPLDKARRVLDPMVNDLPNPTHPLRPLPRQPAPYHQRHRPLDDDLNPRTSNPTHVHKIADAARSRLTIETI